MTTFRLIYFVALVGGVILVNLKNGNALKGPKIDTDYSEAEMEALADLHKEVDDILLQDYMKTDEYLIHFLRAKKGNVQESARLLRKTMKWRSETNAAEILNESFPALKRQYPYKIDFEDKEGRPVILMFFGRWNLRNAIISGQRAQLLRYFDQMVERAVSKAREIRKTRDIDINRFMFMVDMNAYSFTTHGCLNCVPLILDFAIHLETYYPAQAIRIYTINTPRLFIPVFELIKPLMHETTVAGFKVYGPDKAEWKAELLKVIPENVLPPEYGGTRDKSGKSDKSVGGPKDNEVSESK